MNLVTASLYLLASAISRGKKMLVLNHPTLFPALERSVALFRSLILHSVSVERFHKPAAALDLLHSHQRTKLIG